MFSCMGMEHNKDLAITTTAAGKCLCQIATLKGMKKERVFYKIIMFHLEVDGAVTFFFIKCTSC